MFTPLTIRRDTAIVHLTKGYRALIDSEAWHVIGLHMWQATSDESGLIYAIHSSGMRMHRLLCPCGPNKTPDHINGDTLDNRSRNLRPATRQQNAQNNRRHKRTSNTGYRGAYWDINKEQFVAKISINCRLTNLGQFPDAVSAALAYDEAARKHYGAFAQLNFPDEAKAPERSIGPCQDFVRLKQNRRH